MPFEQRSFFVAFFRYFFCSELRIILQNEIGDRGRVIHAVRVVSVKIAVDYFYIAAGIYHAFGQGIDI